MKTEWIYSHRNACRMCNRGYDEREMYDTEVNADEVCYECYHEIEETNQDAEPLAGAFAAMREYYQERNLTSEMIFGHAMGIKVGNA